MNIIFTKKKVFFDYLFVTIGCIIQTFAVAFILKPNNLTVGGSTGISLSLEKILNINYTYIYYFVSLLILLLTRIFLGKKEFKKTIFITFAFPIILSFQNKYSFNFIDNVDDKLLICIYYGIFMGAGTGIILKRGFAPGGTDNVCKIIHKYWLPFMNLSEVMLIIDAIIIILSGTVFGKTAVFYAIVMKFITTKAMDVILFGFGSSFVKMVILSKENEKIFNFLKNMGKGYSVDYIFGGFTHEKTETIVTVCTLREAMLIKQYITKIDTSAFINIVPVLQVWGREKSLPKLTEKED